MANKSKRNISYHTDNIKIYSNDEILKNEKFSSLNHKSIKSGKRVARYRTGIMVMLGLAALLPMSWSFYNLRQVKQLEEQVTQLVKQKQNGQNNEEVKETAGQNADASGSKEVEQNPQNEVSIAKRVYLTFDDGPSDHTEEILDILKKYHAKATFFVIGKQDEHSMKMYNEIVRQGHTIGIHSYTHEYDKIYASKEAFKKDVTSMSELIYEATGTHTRLYRFPGGSANTVCHTSMPSLIKWLNHNGYVYYDWNALSGDAVTKGLSPSTLVANVMDGIKKNKTVPSIVLMHDINARHNTVESLEPLIKKLQKQGYYLDQPLTEEVTPIQQKKVQDVLSAKKTSKKQNKKEK